jgi:hypothetical protein
MMVVVQVNHTDRDYPWLVTFLVKDTMDELAQAEETLMPNMRVWFGIWQD